MTDSASKSRMYKLGCAVIALKGLSARLGDYAEPTLLTASNGIVAFTKLLRKPACGVTC